MLFSEKHNRWQCGSHHPQRQFTVKTGTIFEDSPLGLDKWLLAMWQVVNCKNGVSCLCQPDLAHFDTLIWPRFVLPALAGAGFHAEAITEQTSEDRVPGALAELEQRSLIR